MKVGWTLYHIKIMVSIINGIVCREMYSKMVQNYYLDASIKFIFIMLIKCFAM